MKVKVDGWRAHITFSSAHFIPEYDQCGRLHGHTYAIHAEVEGEPDARGIVIDFSALKAALHRIAQELDHHVLLPDRGDIIKNRTEKCIDIHFRNKDYVLPTADCIFLPMVSTSAENLAAHVLQRLRQELPLPANVSALHIGVDEGYGQGAWRGIQCRGTP